MKHYYSLDYIRVIAMVGILTDHAICFYGSNTLNYSGIQIGGQCYYILCYKCFAIRKQWADFAIITVFQFVDSMYFSEYKDTTLF